MRLFLTLTLAAMAFCGFLSPVAHGDGGCGSVEGTILPDEVWDPNIIEGDLLLSDEQVLSGIVYVNGSLSLVDCDLVLEGAGVIVMEGGELSMINSTISPDPGIPGLTIFLEVRGDVTIVDSALYSLVDPRDNIGLVGMYVYRGDVRITDSKFIDSGMIAMRDCSSLINGSTLSGAYFLEGNHTLDSCSVYAYGLTMHGGGLMSVTNTIIRSDVEFYSDVAGISATGWGRLSVTDVAVSGTYTSALFAGGTRVDISNISVVMDMGLFGIKFDEAHIRSLKDVRVSGVHTGISLYECYSQDVAIRLSDVYLKGTRLGLLASNTQRLLMERFTVDGSDIGIRSTGPLELKDGLFKDNGIGLLLEGGSANFIENCSFENYGIWAIQEQSWDMTDHPANEFIPGSESIGRIAWWGYVDIDVSGPGGIPVIGAKLILNSNIGSYSRSPGRIDLIWGYREDHGKLSEVTYEMNAYWGISRKIVDIDPERGMHLTVEIPLADPFIESLSVDDGSAVVRVGMNGDGEGHAVITLTLNGGLFRREAVNLTSGSLIDLSIPLSDIPEGEHKLEAELYSQDEYGDPSLQGNNHRELEFSRSRPIDRTALASWLLVSILVLFFLILLMRTPRPKD